MNHKKNAIKNGESQVGSAFGRSRDQDSARCSRDGEVRSHHRSDKEARSRRDETHFAEPRRKHRDKQEDDRRSRSRSPHERRKPDGYGLIVSNELFRFVVMF